MFINRNNYESFFLLYVDGELSAQEMRAVETFASENADLQPELELLMEAVLAPETVLFEDKGNLFRPVPIDSSMMEKLLLKTDNELPETESVLLNELIATDVNIKAEYELLQRTKSDASEEIIFAEKHLLYRRERDNVVIGRFVRWAAAAVLIGFGLFIGVQQINKLSHSESVATNPVNVPVKSGHTVKALQDSQALAKSQDVTNINDEIVVSSKTADPTFAKNVLVEKLKDKNTAREDQKVILQNDTPAPNQTAVTPKQKSGIDVPLKERITEEPKLIIAAADQKPKTGLDNSIVPLENSYAMAASYNPEERSENRILYMDEDDVKRSKAGGFLRKIKRFAERTAKIKTGNSLRIAGFEIAAK